MPRHGRATTVLPDRVEANHELRTVEFLTDPPRDHRSVGALRGGCRAGVRASGKSAQRRANDRRAGLRDFAIHRQLELATPIVNTRRRAVACAPLTSPRRAA